MAQSWSPKPFQPNNAASQTTVNPLRPVTATNPSSSVRHQDASTTAVRASNSSDAPVASSGTVNRWRKSSLAANKTNANGLSRNDVFSTPPNRPSNAVQQAVATSNLGGAQVIQTAQFVAQPPIGSLQQNAADQIQTPANPLQSPNGAFGDPFAKPEAAPAQNPPSLQGNQFDLGPAEPAQEPSNSPNFESIPKASDQFAPGQDNQQPEPMPQSPAGEEELPPSPFQDNLIPPNPFPGSRGNPNNAQSPLDSTVGQMPRDTKKLTEDCDAVRAKALGKDITEVRLDISPEMSVGSRTRESADQRRKNFRASSVVRPWHNYRGEFIADAKFIDFEKYQVLLETSNGAQQRVRLSDLSDPDKTYVGEIWGMPVICATSNEAIAAREFIPSTVAWKASALCHKPLYFEEPQLERYGHEFGPVLQPALSTAHFFANIAVLPYKMGIHPMNECQYALGYYRPGSCAPWTLGPIPLSIRGAVAEAGVVGGAIAIFP
jgi:SLA1 homology domain 1, SHD1